MDERHAFQILPKENALFLDDEHSAPKQRSFMPPKGDAMGRRPKPIPLAEPKVEPLPMEQFLAEETEDA